MTDEKVYPWKIKTSALNIRNKRLQESITSIENGYMGMRGNFEEGFSGDTHIGTYVAGRWCPDKWTSYSFFIKYCGRLLDVQVNAHEVSVELVEGKPLEVELYDQSIVLTLQVVTLIQSTN